MFSVSMATQWCKTENGGDLARDPNVTMILHKPQLNLDLDVNNGIFTMRHLMYFQQVFNFYGQILLQKAVVVYSAFRYETH